MARTPRLTWFSVTASDSLSAALAWCSRMFFACRRRRTFLDDVHVLAAAIVVMPGVRVGVAASVNWKLLGRATF